MSSKRLRPSKLVEYLKSDSHGIAHWTLPRLNSVGLEEAVSILKENYDEKSLRGCWLWLTGKDELKLIQTALDLGFRFHHARGDEVCLGLWLCDERKSTLPIGASHTVGVGCFVVDVAARKVLVVKERHGPEKNSWKIVTGFVESSESIKDAATREVREETGVILEDRNCVEMIACREAHEHIFGLSNLYFVCLFVVLDGTSSQSLKRNETEIDDAKWVSLEDYEKIAFDDTIYGYISKAAVEATWKLVSPPDAPCQVFSPSEHRVTLSRNSAEQTLWSNKRTSIVSIDS